MVSSYMMAQAARLRPAASSVAAIKSFNRAARIRKMSLRVYTTPTTRARLLVGEFLVGAARRGANSTGRRRASSMVTRETRRILGQRYVEKLARRRSALAEAQAAAAALESSQCDAYWERRYGCSTIEMQDRFASPSLLDISMKSRSTAASQSSTDDEGWEAATTSSVKEDSIEAVSLLGEDEQQPSDVPPPRISPSTRARRMRRESSSNNLELDLVGGSPPTTKVSIASATTSPRRDVTSEPDAAPSERWRAVLQRRLK